MSYEASEQYTKALKRGQKYMRAAVAAGKSPYPLVLDRILDERSAVSTVSLGLVNVPAERIVGTKSLGRTSALTGDFMPMLAQDSEFGTKWIHLCDAHLRDGIRDPIKAYEYLGRFYVEEGNKRVSVLRSYDAPTVPAMVTRLVPQLSDAPEIRCYYAFLDYYKVSGLYEPELSRPEDYRRLLALLGVAQDHVWTQEERRSFLSGYTRLREVLAKTGSELPPGELMLLWLQVYSFADLKNLSLAELKERVRSLCSDAQAGEDSIELKTKPEAGDKNLVAKLISIAKPERLKVAMIYAYDPAQSEWTLAHDHGREYLEQAMNGQVSVQVYTARNHDYDAAMEGAAEDGARLIIATTPPMIDACRRFAAGHKNIRVLNCGLSQPYTGVRMYYGRMYECKFITGAIAGAMSNTDLLGYIASYPIAGTPASINAFALGARMTRPSARVLLRWTSVEQEICTGFLHQGVEVISGLEANDPSLTRWTPEKGTYRLNSDGSVLPLAVPCWNWGRLYEQIVRSILAGAWELPAADRPINYWWGLDTGAVDLTLTARLPQGVRRLALLLKDALAQGRLDPFAGRILDQHGRLRADEGLELSMDERMQMDWLCDNVEGEIPDFDKLLPESRELVRHLGVFRSQIEPVKEEKQL